MAMKNQQQPITCVIGHSMELAVDVRKFKFDRWLAGKIFHEVGSLVVFLLELKSGFNIPATKNNKPGSEKIKNHGPLGSLSADNQCQT